MNTSPIVDSLTGLWAELADGATAGTAAFVLNSGDIG